ncbi:MAG TPA: RDD family protein [Nakamurella sp.]
MTRRDPTRAAETDPSGLVIGDAVELDLPIARVASRGIARLIDLPVQIIAGLFIGQLLVLAAGAVGSLDAAVMGVIQVVVQVVIFIAYPVLLETLTRGRTLGKFAMGLRVVRDDGGAIRFRQALTRGLIGTAAEWPGLLPPLTWFASLACMQSDPRSKRLGDLGAGTIVIHERTPLVWGWIPVMPMHLAGWAATLDLGGVSDALALEIRQYLIRYRSLHAKARTALGNDLTVELAGCIKPLPPSSINGRDFLVAVLAERHRRSVARLVATRTAAATVWPELMVATGQGAWLPSQPTVPLTAATPVSPATLQPATPPAQIG